MARVHEPLTEAVLQEGFFAGEVVADPWEHLARLRSAGPLAWNEAGWWVASHHQVVQAASVDPSRFCSSRGILVSEIGVTYPSPPTMMHTDPPDHTRYRSLVAPAFRPSAMRSLGDALRTHVDRLLGDIATTADAVDIVEHLTLPFPLVVICELLGVPWEDWKRFSLWSDISIPGATDHTADERRALQAEMIGYLLAATAAKAAQPRDDVLTLLAGAGLSELEVSMFAVQLLAAGNETTRNALSAGLIALAEHPDQWRRLRDDRRLVPFAVEEILRWSSPVTYFMRTAVAATTLGGAAIGAGDPVVLHYAAANRDDAEFGPTAATFDVGRTPNHHLAFGFGTHYCLGAALARQEIAAVLDAMLERYVAIEPAGPVERTRSAVIAGIRRAPLRLVPA